MARGPCIRSGEDSTPRLRKPQRTTASRYASHYTDGLKPKPQVLFPRRASGIRLEGAGRTNDGPHATLARGIISLQKDWH